MMRHHRRAAIKRRANGRADFDKRYDEVYKPAIEEAGFEPYRVDRDPSAAIPNENIESGRRHSVLGLNAL